MSARPIFTLNKKECESIAKISFNEFKGNYESANISILYISELLNSNNVNDGYLLAKELEDNHSEVHIDTLIVEELNNLYPLVYEKINKLNREWVSANNIVPLLKIDDKVFFKNEIRNINNIDFSYGKYLIGVEENNRNRNWIVNYEDIESEQTPK